MCPKLIVPLQIDLAIGHRRYREETPGEPVRRVGADSSAGGIRRISHKPAAGSGRT
jgi:hypothetical protein